MAQFDVYRNHRENGEIFPYLLDITHKVNTISQLRVVVPLCNDSHAAKHLNPTFDIEGKRVYMSTMDIAGIPVGFLDERIMNLEQKRAEIVDALDFLVNGF